MILQNIIYYKEPEIINSQISWNSKPNTIEEQNMNLKSTKKVKLDGINEGSFVKQIILH